MKIINTPFLTGCLLMAILLFVNSSASFAQDQDGNDGHNKERGVHIGLVYPLSTHGTHAKEYTNIFSLHAIAGISRSEKGFSASGFANLILEDARGFQHAGFINLIGGKVEGATTAGIINIYRGGTGFQQAGVINFSRGDIKGMQASGFLNMSRNLEGFQSAGFFNIAKDVRGMQAAGFINNADDVRGVQMAGFINLADSVNFQAAGFINIAKKVRGVQLAGFINIADSSDYPIGIINIIKNGEQRIGVTIDDNLTTIVAFRSGGRKLYGILGLGYNFNNADEVYALQAGIGAHFFSGEKFGLNTEIATIVLEDFERGGSFTKQSLSILPSFKLSPKLEISAGPSFSYVNTDSKEGRKLLDYDIWSRNKNGHLHSFYIGYSAGIHFLL